MPSYLETVKIPFGGLELINIPVEEIHVRYKAGPDPEVLVVKELWVKPRQWAKGKPLPRTYVPGSPEWELLSEQLRDVVALGGWIAYRASDLLVLMDSPAASIYSYLFNKEEVFSFLPNFIFLVPFLNIPLSLLFVYYYY